MDNRETNGIMVAAGSVEPPKMPSADLINFRFDQSDKQMSEVNRKLDHLTNSFVTKEEVAALRDECNMKIAEIQRSADTDKANRRWWNRMLATATFSALFVSLGTLIIYVILKIHTP